jgi:hypothetical protein
MNTINSIGLSEIKEFLIGAHKNGGIFDDSQIHAWADDAEFQMREGNSPSIEVPARNSVTGATVEFTVSDDGIDLCLGGCAE